MKTGFRSSKTMILTKKTAFKGLFGHFEPRKAFKKRDNRNKSGTRAKNA